MSIDALADRMLLDAMQRRTRDGVARRCVKWSAGFSIDDAPRHVLALRGRMNEALQAAGFVISGYQDPGLQSMLFRAVHISELQNRVK